MENVSQATKTMPSNIFLSFAMEHKSLVDRFRRQVTESCSALNLRDYTESNLIHNFSQVPNRELLKLLLS